MFPHLIRRAHSWERPRFERAGRFGWLLITRRHVFARGFMARVWA